MCFVGWWGRRKETHTQGWRGKRQKDASLEKYPITKKKVEKVGKPGNPKPGNLAWNPAMEAGPSNGRGGSSHGPNMKGIPNQRKTTRRRRDRSTKQKKQDNVEDVKDKLESLMKEHASTLKQLEESERKYHALATTIEGVEDLERELTKVTTLNPKLTQQNDDNHDGSIEVATKLKPVIAEEESLDEKPLGLVEMYEALRRQHEHLLSATSINFYQKSQQGHATSKITIHLIERSKVLTTKA